ncbi:hypothetical protein NEOC95_001755 [Neochlamydia sp. AcF95]|nr:hypothetical protein [Neochlamydia sp. AcF95]
MSQGRMERLKGSKILSNKKGIGIKQRHISFNLFTCSLHDEVKVSSLSSSLLNSDLSALFLAIYLIF